MIRMMFAFLLVGIVATAQAHPGRLDAEGCHRVHEDFKYANGRLVRVGERHCHRLLGDMKLDGVERLQGAPHDHRDAPERCLTKDGEYDSQNPECPSGY